MAGCSVDRSEQQADKPTIRIGYQTFPSGDLIVKNNRWLEEALPDYNIKWTKFDSGADVNTAFIAKELDFGALGSSPVARGLSAPLNIPYKVAFVLDVAGDNEALVARNGSGINTIAELRGKRIGTPFASTAHYSLLAALAQNGLSANDVQLVDLQPQADRWRRSTAATSTPSTPGCRRSTSCARTARTSSPAASSPRTASRRWTWPRCPTSSPTRTPRSSTPGASSRPVRSTSFTMIRQRPPRRSPRRSA